MDPNLSKSDGSSVNAYDIDSNELLKYDDSKESKECINLNSVNNIAYKKTRKD
ncbi:2007_t:CDS:2 [Diversispora eburnea]|uniref:2007_t:CDS:1 n=1 Tax=Diversispora eburnea TaxID=1213867 RepID=A0A9N9BYX2_9GLOM|nr:2007_t:CDS:2 [Diversispora eburnea]